MPATHGRSVAKAKSGAAPKAKARAHTGAPRLRIERVFNAPRELVWRAWTDRRHLVRWWGPDGFSCPVAEMDVRVGGEFRTCMTEPNGTEHWVSGTYLTVEPPQKLVFTWAWDTDGKPGHRSTVTLELFAQGRAKTRLVLNHGGHESPASRKSHRWGWSSSLDCLARELAAAK